MHTPEYDGDSYSRAVLDTENLRKNIATLAKTAKALDFDAIAFRGHSGSLLAAPLALKLKKSLILVRKPSEDSHSAFDVSGDVAAKRYLIVDDLICSGATVRSIVEEVKVFAPNAVCIGALVTSRKNLQKVTEDG